MVQERLIHGSVASLCSATDLWKVQNSLSGEASKVPMSEFQSADARILGEVSFH